jgi:hypothetical protein
LPIAKKLADEGYNVEWPLWSDIFPHFTKGHINYVNFKKINSSIEEWYFEILEYCKINNIEPIDITFNQLGAWHNKNTQQFNSQKKIPFDEFKYNLAKIDLNEKWNLTICRNEDRENSLFEKIINQSDYVVTHFQGSDIHKSVKLENKNNLQIVEITPQTDCVFDWIKILKNSKYLVMIDSVFSNLTEQLNIENKKFFIKRRDFINTPTLKNNWIFIE